MKINEIRPLEWKDTYCISPASDLSYTDAIDEIKVGEQTVLYIRYHIHVYYDFTPDRVIDRITVGIRKQGFEVFIPGKEVASVEEGKALVEEWRENYFNELINNLFDKFVMEE